MLAVLGGRDEQGDDVSQEAAELWPFPYEKDGKEEDNLADSSRYYARVLAESMRPFGRDEKQNGLVFRGSLAGAGGSRLALKSMTDGDGAPLYNTRQVLM